MKDGYDITEGVRGFRLRVWGRDERELFSRALLGLAAVMRPDVAPSSGKAGRVRVHIRGDNWAETLLNFLRHAAFECEMQGAVFSAMDIIELGPNEIECELVGKTVERFEEEIDHIHCLSEGIRKTPERLEVELRAAVL